MASPSRPITALVLAAAVAGCAHPRRPPLATRAALREVVLADAGEPPRTEIDGDGAPGRKVAGGTAVGALKGALFLPYVCTRGAYATLILCVAGGIVIGLPAVLAIEGASTIIGATVGGARASHEVAPVRAAQEAARALLERHGADGRVREALVAGALAAPEVARNVRLLGAAPLDSTVPNVQVALLEAALEPDRRRRTFRLRMRSRAALLVAGREVGATEVSVRDEGWNAVEAWSGPEADGAPLREALVALASRAGAAAVADLLAGLDASSLSPTYEGVCGLGPLSADGAAYEGLGPEVRAVSVPADRRTLAWERWKPRSGALGPDAAVTYDLRVWRPDADAPPLEVTGLSAPSWALPADVAAGAAHHFTVRAVVTAQGQRFTTPWSRLGGDQGDCVPGEPRRDALFAFVLEAPAPPAPAQDEATAASQ